MIVDLNSATCAELKAQMTLNEPAEFFAFMQWHDLLAQFVSPLIPEARQLPVALVRHASDEEQVKEEANNLFLLFVSKFKLGYDDFPPSVRVWDHQVRIPASEQSIEKMLDWDDDNFLTEG